MTHADEFSVWIEGGGRNGGRRRVVYSGSELDRLRRMARAIGGRVPQTAPAPREEARFLSAQNRLLKRGATLHTTTALTRPQQTDSVPGGAATRWEGMIRFDDGASSASTTDRITGSSRAVCSTW
jgi:hypothetical protein